VRAREARKTTFGEAEKDKSFKEGKKTSKRREESQNNLYNPKTRWSKPIEAKKALYHRQNGEDVDTFGCHGGPRNC
jgi:hypothetical protein